MKIILICGTSPTLLSDFWKALDLLNGYEYDVCCVNRAISIIPCMMLEWPKYWYSYHVDIMRKEYGDTIPVCISTVQKVEGAEQYPLMQNGKGLQDWAGSSGLQAVKVALKYWKYDIVILAGISLHPPYKDLFIKGWRRAFKAIKGKVFSFSGATKDLLGAPTKEILNGKR